MAQVYKGLDKEDLLNSIGLTEDRVMSKFLNLNRVNVNKIFHYVDAVNYGKMYIFFTRPDLNLFVDNKGTINPTIKRNAPDLYMKIANNPLIAAQLQSSVNPEGTLHGQGFMHILSTYCNSADIPEINLSMKPGVANSKGQETKLGGDLFEATGSGSFSIGFVDNRDRDIQTMMEIWVMYIEAVANGTIDPKLTYIADNRVDYAISCFIFTVDEMYNILYSMQLVGIFPTGMNVQLGQYSPLALEAERFLGPFTYPFHYTTMAIPNTHTIMESFNYVSDFGRKVKFNTGETVDQFMFKKKGQYYIHNGIIPTSAFLPKSVYPYHFDLYDKHPELVGVSYNVNSAGVLLYKLVFASSKFHKGERTWTDVGHPITPDVKPGRVTGYDDPRKPGGLGIKGLGVPIIGEGSGQSHLYRRIREHTLEESNGIPMDNVNRFNAGYQYEANTEWNNAGFSGWGSWDMGSGRYGTRGGDNSAYALSMVNSAINALKSFF